MACGLRSAISAAALAACLAGSPAVAQNIVPPGNIAPPFGGGHPGGFHGGAIGAPVAPPAGPQIVAPQIVAPQAPAQQLPPPMVVPQARFPHAGPGGGFRAPSAGGGYWPNAGVAAPPYPTHAWPGAGAAHAPHDTAQSMYLGGRHRNHGGHWRGGAGYPSYVGGYDPYPAYEPEVDEDYCVLGKVRVHTRHGWRRVWRRVCP